MFETIMISASDRLRRWGRIIAVSAVILCSWFTPIAQADVPIQGIFPILANASGVLPPPDSIAFSRTVAIGQVLQRLVRKSDGSFDAPFAKRLGFDLNESVVEVAVQQAFTSLPIALFRIGLKRLQQFNPGLDSPLMLLAADANWGSTLSPSLLPILSPSRFLFPITVKDAGKDVVKSSLRLKVNFPSANSTPAQLGFEIERFGSSTLIRKIDEWRRNPNISGIINREYFLVSVPALDRYYLGRMRGNTLTILAITDDPQISLREGQESDAQEVFRKLKVEALTIDADDPDAPPR